MELLRGVLQAAQQEALHDLSECESSNDLDCKCPATGAVAVAASSSSSSKGLCPFAGAAAAQPRRCPVAHSATGTEQQQRGDEVFASAGFVRKLHSAMGKVEVCFGRVVRECLPLMFERVGEHGALCDYYFFYARLRPFISGFDAIVFEGEWGDAPQTLGSRRPVFFLLLGRKFGIPSETDIVEYTLSGLLLS